MVFIKACVCTLVHVCACMHMCAPWECGIVRAHCCQGLTQAGPCRRGGSLWSPRVLGITYQKLLSCSQKLKSPDALHSSNRFGNHRCAGRSAGPAAGMQACVRAGPLHCHSAGGRSALCAPWVCAPGPALPPRLLLGVPGSGFCLQPASPTEARAATARLCCWESRRGGFRETR